LILSCLFQLIFIHVASKLINSHHNTADGDAHEHWVRSPFKVCKDEGINSKYAPDSDGIPNQRLNHDVLSKLVIFPWAFLHSQNSYDEVDKVKTGKGETHQHASYPSSSDVDTPAYYLLPMALDAGGKIFNH
jgi:hypothetical protein